MIEETVPMATDRQRSIDHGASEQEWDLLLQWMEEATVTIMDSNDNSNPWLKPVSKEDMFLPSTGFYSDTRHEDVQEG